MEQASMLLYIRFGEIPKDGKSKVYRGNAVVRKEGGISVYRAVEDQGKYWPVIPSEANEHAVSDYFYLLINSNRKVYLVAGNELSIEGADREPLLTDVIMIKEITDQFRKKPKKNNKTQGE